MTQKTKGTIALIAALVLTPIIWYLLAFNAEYLSYYVGYSVCYAAATMACCLFFLKNGSADTFKRILLLYITVITIAGVVAAATPWASRYFFSPKWVFASLIYPIIALVVTFYTSFKSKILFACLMALTYIGTMVLWLYPEIATGDFEISLLPDYLLTLILPPLLGIVAAVLTRTLRKKV